MATSLAPVITQLLDDYGYVLAGGYIDTFEAGTTTPLATYIDLDGAVPNANPVVLDAAGRATIRVTDGVAYKFMVYDADGNLIDTIDDIIVGTAEGASDSSLIVSRTYIGTPGAQGFMGAEEIVNSVVFPVDWDGASGSVQTSPASDFAITVKKDGVDVGTITIDSSGVFSFETTGGGTVACSFGNTLSFWAPSSVGTATDFAWTLVGAVA